MASEAIAFGHDTGRTTKFMVAFVETNGAEPYKESHMRRSFQAVLLIVLLVSFSGRAVATLITHKLVVNPIQVRDDSGANPANPTMILFEAETDKIWDQAGIDIEFLPWKLMDSAVSQNITATSDLLIAGNQALGGTIINMWFVIDYAGAFGAANSAGRRVAIDDSVFAFSAGAGRRDTIAHELGHIMGLPHIAGDFPLNLMEEGGVRNPATAIGQITPDGDLKDQLTQAQIDIALASSYLVIVPEPSTLVLLVGVGLSGLCGYGWRRRKKAA